MFTKVTEIRLIIDPHYKLNQISYLNGDIYCLESGAAIADEPTSCLTTYLGLF